MHVAMFLKIIFPILFMSIYVLHRMPCILYLLSNYTCGKPVYSLHLVLTQRVVYT